MKPLAYYELKAAQALFEKSCGALDAAETRKVAAVARRYADMEAAVLASDEARGVCVPDGAAEAALTEIRGRYPDPDAFAADLAASGLDEGTLAVAVQRDLRVDTVLARVGAQAGETGSVEAEIFYYAHLNRFRSPERRTARHILITVNEDLADNRREVAQRRIGEIARRLAAKPDRFEEQAYKHSECPTALNGGLLGEVPRGQLYPALDAALYAMRAGEVSGVLESELGFHVLRCDQVHPARTVGYTEVATTLRDKLTAQRAQRHARQWLAALLAARTAAAA
jgi:nitrogen fixation protein NifM